MEGAVAGVDGLLASAGYNVRCTELKEVAHKLGQLEMAMGVRQEAAISLDFSSSQMVHYNPSDLAGWLESMLSEFDSHAGLSAAPQTERERDESLINSFGSSSSSSSSSAQTQIQTQTHADECGIVNLPVVAGFLDDCSFYSNIDSLFSPPGGALTDASLFLHPSNSPTPPIESHSQPQQQNIRPNFNPHRPQSKSAPLHPAPAPAPNALLLDNGLLQAPGHEGGSRHRKRSRCESSVMLEERSLKQQRQMVGVCGEEESGVRLVQALVACAEAVHHNNLAMADKMVNRVTSLAEAQTGPMAKVATYFAQAIAARIYDGFPSQTDEDRFASEALDIHFYETCPYLKFAHFTANQAILDAFEGEDRVLHVIDFNLRQGMQWPALIQALALRPGGPPPLRLTAIHFNNSHGIISSGNHGFHEVGARLAQLAESINVELDFRTCVVSGPSDLKSWVLDVRPGEAVAVNSIFELHRLIDASQYPIDQVLASIRSLKPKIVTMVEQEANHNSPVFLDRFTEALHYYSSMFDSVEACKLPPLCPEKVMSEMYLGREIRNIVGCEGLERVERHETLMQWRLRMFNAGFETVPLGSNAFKQATMLLTLFSDGDGYTVEENTGCLSLAWHARPLIAASAWH